LMVFDQMIGRLHQLHAYDNRQGAADHPGAYGEEQVKGADVLVVGRAQPAGKKARCVTVLVRVVAMRVGDVSVPLVSHPSLPRSQLPAGAGRAASGEPGTAATR